MKGSAMAHTIPFGYEIGLLGRAKAAGRTKEREHIERSCDDEKEHRVAVIARDDIQIVAEDGDQKIDR